MRSPSASTWPKLDDPDVLDAVDRVARDLLLGRSGARVQFHPLLDGSSTSASRPAPKVTAATTPPHRRRRRRSPTAPGPTSRPSPGSRAMATPSWLEGAKGPLAQQGRGRPSTQGRRRSGQADPSWRAGAEGRARTEQEHEQSSAPIAQHEHVDVDPGVGLGLPRLTDRHEQRSRRSRARRQARRRPR